MTDRELLSKFIENRSEAAFAGLVDRYLDLVYSAARRQVGERASAEDVCQMTFVLLARKAPSIRNRDTIAGWLLVTTRRVALNMLRAESRRKRHESESAVMRPAESPRDADPAIHVEQNEWNSIQCELDDAVSALNDADRDAVTLRFFQKQTFEQVAGTLGVSPEAARKRVERALAKLRSVLAARGVTASAQGLSVMILTNGIDPAPAHLSSHIAQAALSASRPAAGTLGLLKGALVLMTTSKASLTALTMLGLLGVLAPVGYFVLRGAEDQPASAPASAAPVVAYDAQTEMEKAYGLKPGENVRRFRSPFIKARKDYILENNPWDRDGEQGTLLMHWNEDHLEYRGGGDAPLTVRTALRVVCDIWSQETDIPRELLMKEAPGDWVIRADTKAQEKIADLCAALSDMIGQDAKLQLEQVQREAIIVRGKMSSAAVVNIYTDALPTDRDMSMNTESASAMMQWTGELSGRPVVIEADLPTNEMLVRASASLDPRSANWPADAATVRKILSNLSAQTGLEFALETREVPIWRLVKKSQ